MTRLIVIAAALVLVGGGVFLIQSKPGETFNVDYSKQNPSELSLSYNATKPTDIENQKPLSNPPTVIKAIYSTGWSAGAAKIDHIINIAKTTEVNAVVIDIKDYSGLVSYDIQVPDVVKYGAKQIRIPRINTLIKRLHDAGIYVIGRVTVFQDPMLAKARPDLAIKNSDTGKVWQDRHGLSWIDPAAKDAWDYVISIAKDATARGFDEINFDYIRFPSDGDLTKLQYPFFDTKTLKRDTIRKFFQYLRANLQGIKISADIFGLTTVNKDDLGIGQYLEYAYESFDYVAPMIYPSHFANGFIGYKNPADAPYEVIKYSMTKAISRLMTFLNPPPKTVTNADGTKTQVPVPLPVNKAKLRPWLQDFNLGAIYDAAKVRAQIDATYDSFCSFDTVTFVKDAVCDPTKSSKTAPLYGGWMIWDPANNYHAGAFKTE